MCEIELVPWKENLGLASIGLQKSSPYLPFMKQVIVDIQANGVLKNLNQRWLTKQPICRRSNTVPISPKKLILCFIWIILGMVVAFMTLLIEYCCGRKSSTVKVINKDIIKISLENYTLNLVNQHKISGNELTEIIQDVDKSIKHSYLMVEKFVTVSEDQNIKKHQKAMMLKSS